MFVHHWKSGRDGFESRAMPGEPLDHESFADIPAVLDPVRMYLGWTGSPPWIWPGLEWWDDDFFDSRPLVDLQGRRKDTWQVAIDGDHSGGSVTGAPWDADEPSEQMQMYGFAWASGTFDCRFPTWSLREAPYFDGSGGVVRSDAGSYSAYAWAEVMLTPCDTLYGPGPPALSLLETGRVLGMSLYFVDAHLDGTLGTDCASTYGLGCIDLNLRKTTEYWASSYLWAHFVLMPPGVEPSPDPTHALPCSWGRVKAAVTGDRH